VRIRALLFLLALTAGDYLLWKWSIAGSHDVLSLLAGCTLVPLLAISAYRLVLAVAGLLSQAARRSSTSARTRRTQRNLEVEQRSPYGPAAESDSSSGRLAA
jgi:membrane protein implicated in regulation of membrane protease activity